MKVQINQRDKIIDVLEQLAEDAGMRVMRVGVWRILIMFIPTTKRFEGLS